MRFASLGNGLLPIVAVLLLSLTLACEKDDENFAARDGQIAGTYRLAEAYIDPGDGSGTFQPVSSSRTVSVAADSTFSSNQDLCQFEDGGAPSEGSFDASGRITMEGCEYGPWTVEFAPGEMIVSYLCFEGCGQRYVRVP